MNLMLTTLASEGLLESTDDPLMLTLIGFGLLAAALIVYVVHTYVVDDESSAGIVLDMASLMLLFGGLYALFTGLFGE